MYNHEEIDSKWQKKWEETQVFRALDPNETDKKPYYCLIEFPFPSGAGLHVGHPRSYTALDVIARKRRAEGYNVLYPIGWDAFGLPTENYAIKTGRPPQDVTTENIATFTKQLKALGISFDWSREVNTTDPAYYKWTQWMFLEFFKAGLAYKTKMAINWCPKDKIGLANEEVVNGCCERCGTAVEKRDKEQWMIAITKYADRLLSDLDTVNYLPKIRKQQEDWIGRKEGMIIHHKVKDLDIVLDTFTAYPAWLFADTFLVIAPEHPLVSLLIAGTEHEASVKDFIAEHKQAGDTEKLEKKGIFTGRTAMDAITGLEMPIWIANFALMDFGTGIIRCSAHDIRDYEFAKKYDIALREVVERIDANIPVNAHDNEGALKESGPFTGEVISKDLIKNMCDWYVEQGYGERHVTYKLRDWVFSRQRYWGEPIPLVQCKNGCNQERGGWVPLPESELPLVLPIVEKYQPTENGESPLASVENWVNTMCPLCGGSAMRETDTMPNWAGSSWYFLRYIDPNNNQQFASKEKLDYWMPVHWYNGGMEHTTLHLLYSRFWNKFLYDRGYVTSSEPYAKRTSHGLIMAEDGAKMSKSKGNVVNPDDIVKEHGADTVRVYELFMGPFSEPVPWSTSGVIGVRRFLDRVMRIADYVTEEESKEVTTSVHRALHTIMQAVEDMKFNTAVATLMSCVNDITEARAITKDSLTRFLIVFGWFAPHTANELYSRIHGGALLEQCAIPVVNEQYLVRDTLVIGVQVNGKLRGTITVKHDAMEAEIIALARMEANVAKYITQEPKKVIYIPGKIVSFIVS